MKIGLIGLPLSGKTTIFNALTNSGADTNPYAGSKAEPNVAVVNVRDARITYLSGLYEPKKTTYATIEITDFAGISGDAEKKEIFSGKGMALIKTMQALALVLRNFRDDLRGNPSPLEDLGRIESELLLSDLIVVETRLERIEAGYKRGQNHPDVKAEEKVLLRIRDHLNQDRPLRELEMNTEEKRIVRGFQFLTQKPLMVILNSGEDNFEKSPEVVSELEKKYAVVEFAGRFEMDVAAMDPGEAALFMEDMGIRESARDRLTGIAYRIMDYISFFTVGQDEVRAWTIRSGMTAVDAAGAIHTDLARGFIRAEVFTYADLIELGSEKAIKEKGRFRLEGKEYIVKDSDILNIRSGI